MVCVVPGFAAVIKLPMLRRFQTAENDGIAWSDRFCFDVNAIEFFYVLMSTATF